MILYVDTSALVKLYIAEGGSAQAARMAAEAEVVSTSLLTYVETRSALARRHKEGDITPAQYGIALADFEADWRGYVLVAVSSHLVRMAAGVAENQGLRVLDALHLASANELAESVGVPVTFLCADRRLAKAAQAEGLEAALVGL